MGEVDRRGFLRILRRDKGTDDATDESAPPPEDPEIRQLADLSASLLIDFGSPEDAEQLAEAPLLTKPYDKAYMRVTADHIAFSFVTGFSTVVKTTDVTSLDLERPETLSGYGLLQVGVLRVQHPADPPGVTRAYQFRFKPDSPLLEAIRTACDLPEPEPEPEPEAGEDQETLNS
jgi:hypothetical protein